MKNLFQIKLAAIFLLGIYSVSLNAQVSSQNNNIWLHYVGKFSFNPKWSFTFEGTKRYTEMGKKPQQWFVRPSIDYALNKNYTASIGYSHYKTFVYGNPAMFFMPIPEDHLWLQINSKHQIGKWSVQNRLRDENRSVGLQDRTYDSISTSYNYRIKGYEYRNRLRYMILFTRPVYTKEGETKLSLILGNEAFFNIGSFSGKSLMNQNRVIAGMGWHFNKDHQLQLTYIHQNVWNFTNTILENNPCIRISLFNNFTFKQKHHVK